MCRGCESKKYQHLPKCSCGRRFCKRNRRKLGYGGGHGGYSGGHGGYKTDTCKTGFCKPKYCAPKCNPIEEKYTVPVEKDRCPKDVGCFPRERQLNKCDLHSNYQPKDILVVDKNGDMTSKRIKKRALLPNNSKDYVCSVAQCIQETCRRRCTGGKMCKRRCKCGKCKFEPCEDHYNIPVCEPNEKCVDVELHFAVEYAGCDQICGQVKFDLCSTQRCGKKVTVTDLCPSKVFAKSPQKHDGRSNFYKLIFNDVPIGGDDTILSFSRQALDCEEAMCGKDFEDDICITQICVYEK